MTAAALARITEFLWLLFLTGCGVVVAGLLIHWAGGRDRPWNRP